MVTVFDSSSSLYETVSYPVGDNHLIIMNQSEINTICECRYSPKEDVQTTKDSLNIPNIHEIDEEESETEETILNPIPSVLDEDHEALQKTEKTSDNESVYTGESFYSDESCEESEVTNVTSRSLNSSSLINASNLRLNQSLEESDTRVCEPRWEDNQDESCSFNNETSRAATVDRDGFVQSRRSRRWNMTFTDEEMRKIERENELLLRKIMAQQKPRQNTFGEEATQSRISSSAINRKKLQRRIENDNMLLLKRIQQAKSCVYADTSKVGRRLTFL